MQKTRSGDARLAALDLLGAVLDDGASLGEADTEAVDDRDRAYARHLAYGTLRWLSALEWLAARLLKRPLKRKDRDIQRLLLLGLFQLWQDDTADHAAVHATAACAGKQGKAWATGLINAVLRRFQREREALLAALADDAARHAHPAWLLDALRNDWPGDWPVIVDANNRPGPLWLRLNDRFDTADTIRELENSGLQITRHTAAPGAVRVDPPRAVQGLPGFAEGRLSVQDPAAQLAGDLLDATSEHRVLDACAAPGGKTGQLLERLPGLRLLALDRSAARMARVENNLRRLGLPGAAVLQVADAADTHDWWDGEPFDRILLDAPCTATGVIRRHPEIKWLRTPAQVEEAVALQHRLLDALWPLLRPGGMLLYATCSVLDRENGAQAAAFLARHADAAASTIDADWGRQAGPGRQVLPGELEMDGFFYARFSKTA
jgi:16S rRNA (cytosine967-C5)-methyltransferase